MYQLIDTFHVERDLCLSTNSVQTNKQPDDSQTNSTSHGCFWLGLANVYYHFLWFVYSSWFLSVGPSVAKRLLVCRLGYVYNILIGVDIRSGIHEHNHGPKIDLNSPIGKKLANTFCPCLYHALPLCKFFLCFSFTPNVFTWVCFEWVHVIGVLWLLWLLLLDILHYLRVYSPHLLPPPLTLCLSNNAVGKAMKTFGNGCSLYSLWKLSLFSVCWLALAFN